MSDTDLLTLAAQPIRPFDAIPVIDISGLSENAESKAQVASAIREACIHVGFFYVKNHGVEEAVVKSALQASRQLFDLSLEEKLKLDFHESQNFSGYYPTVKRENVHECFQIGEEFEFLQAPL